MSISTQITKVRFIDTIIFPLYGNISITYLYLKQMPRDISFFQRLRLHNTWSECFINADRFLPLH